MSQNTANEQAELGAFDTESTETEDTESDEPVVTHNETANSNTAGESTPESDCDSSSEPDEESLSQKDLSEVTVWDTDNIVTVDGASILHPRSGDFRSLTGSTGISKHRVKLVIDGVDAYLQENDCRQIDVPKYYSGFDDFEPVITKRTAASNDGALGIHGPDLENVIRYIAGKGGFSHGNLSVFVGAQHHYLVTYENESFLVYVDDVSYPADSDFNATSRHVNGFDIPEDDDLVAAGLKPFIEAVETHHDMTVTGHDELITYIQVRGTHLKRIARSTQVKSDITGEFEYETEFGEVYSGEITEDDIESEIGDEQRGRHVVGYTKSVEDPRTSSRASMSGRVKVSVNTYQLLKRDTDTGYVRFEIRSRADTVARFKPEEKDYDPINDPLE